MYEVQVGSATHRCHVNQLRQRFGDKSPEEVFTDTIFPLFFDYSAQNTSPPKTRASPGARGETNRFELPDFHSSSQPDFLPNSCQSSVVETTLPRSSGRSSVVPSDGRVRGRESPKRTQKKEVNMRVSNAQHSPLEGERTMPEEVRPPPINVPGNVSRANQHPTQSHSQRRSNRIRRAPIRFDPSLELQPTSRDRAHPRGSVVPTGQAATRSRGSPSASVGRTDRNFVKGGGVGNVRGHRPWR